MGFKQHHNKLQFLQSFPFIHKQRVSIINSIKSIFRTLYCGNLMSVQTSTYENMSGSNYIFNILEYNQASFTSQLWYTDFARRPYYLILAIFLNLTHIKNPYVNDRLNQLECISLASYCFIRIL